METEAIVEVLGGRKVLGKAIKKPDDLALRSERACQRLPFRRLLKGSIWPTAFCHENSAFRSAR